MTTSDHICPIEDVQNSPDLRSLDIDKVGIKSIKHPVLVKDKTGGAQHTIATFNMYVYLPHNFKGTHMSRFVEILNMNEREISVESFENILREMIKRLESKSCDVEMTFPYFINKTTSLCPCSKKISDYGAHNQRSHVTVTAEINKFIWVEDLIELIEKQASSELYGLLKRPDEKYVTEKAYDNPKFVEDMVRDVAAQLKLEKRVDHFIVESENFESIHNHSAYALIEG